jgi:hypothetical protein
MPPPALTPPARMIPFLQSTPHSRGSGWQYSYQSESDYQPYLKEAITHRYKITFDEFLNDIFLCHGLPLDSANTSHNHDIVSDKRFQTLLSKYCKPVDQETDRYSRFIELANHVIDQLNINPDSRIRFCRNDPVYIKGSHAKPDVAIVLNKSLELLERRDVDNLMEYGPNQAPSWWTELLSFFEFKLVENCLEPRDAVTSDHSSMFILVLFIRLSIYGGSGSVGVELSCRSIASPVYISRTIRGTHFPYNAHPLRFALINPFGFGGKAKP